MGDKDKYRDFNDVLAIDPATLKVEDVGPSMLDEMASLFADKRRTHFPAPLQYGTLYTRATIEFDWEPFLMASAFEPARFGRILDRFGEASLAVARGWTEIEGTELIVIHDDIAATRGPISSPAWFRKYVFPWYARIFEAIHAKGKKVLHITDGNYLPVLDDILATDPDGLYIETSAMDPEELMRRAGKDKFFLIKSDNQNIDFYTPDDIYIELKKLRELHEEFPGMMMYRGGLNPRPGNAEAFDRYYDELLVYA